MAGQTIDLDEIQARICAAQQGGYAPTSPESARNALPRELVQTLWQLMTSMYGHRWTASFGDAVDPDRVWAAALAGVSEQQLRAGMRRCVERGMDWPPSAPEFRTMCLGDDEHWEHRRMRAEMAEQAAKREAERKALPDQAAEARRDRVAHSHLDALRKSFGMQEVAR